VERVHIQTAQNVAIQFEVAGLGDRVLAAILDSLIIYAYLFTVMIALAGAEVDTLSVYIVALLPFFFYFFGCEVLLDGQTLGKKALRIKVVRLDGKQPSVGNYLLRALLRPIDVTISSGMVGLITILANGKGQRLGDLAAGTTVVKLAPRTRISDTVFARLEENHTVTFPQVDALTDQDVQTAKEVLNTLVTQPRSHVTQQLGVKMQTALEEKMGVTSELPTVPFLRTVIKDYNWLPGRERGKRPPPHKSGSKRESEKDERGPRFPGVPAANRVHLRS